LPGIDGDGWKLRSQECGQDAALQAAGGLQHDQGGLQGRQSEYQSGDRRVVVARGPGLVSRKEASSTESVGNTGRLG
jgi:hypothetical protein